MKKVLIILALLMPFAASAADPARKSVSRSEIESIASEFRNYDGVEVIRLGRLATGALKGVVNVAGMTDPDTREALKLIEGLRGVIMVEYEDAPKDIRYRMERRIERALQKCELLMEAKEGDGKMQMFGAVDDSGTVRDVVIHVPDSGALLCLFGTMSMDVLKKAVDQ